MSVRVGVGDAAWVCAGSSAHGSAGRLLSDGTRWLLGWRDAHPETLGYAATAFASVISGIVVDQRGVWDAIDRISAPVLLMWGEDDPMLERSMVDVVLARRPDWNLHVFAGAGHAAPAERPDEYAAAVGRWLTGSAPFDPATRSTP